MLTISNEQKIRDYVEKFNSNDEETVVQAIGNSQAAQWLIDNIPIFECPDKTIEETYYFRWWTYRKHIKMTSDGYVISEFHPDVGWAGLHNTINAAVGHHINEGRWLKNHSRYISDYIRFWFSGKGNIYSYSSWIIAAVYEYCVLINDYSLAIDLLDEFDKYYEEVEKRNLTKHNDLFWSNDDRDAMEMSVSGSGLRPTLNSYMYANALAISKIAEKAGHEDLRNKYAMKAKSLKEAIQTHLWDEKSQFFKVLPTNAKDNAVQLSFDNIDPTRDAKELIGYIPWSFDIPLKTHETAWKYLMDQNFFYAPFGPTTAEKNHSEYMKPASHECLWNGPSWPFATSQTLNSLIKYLHTEKNESYISKRDFLTLMTNYAKSHYRKNENGEIINWIDENLHPKTGEWISRNILKEWSWREDKGGYERGKDYNHSTFCDLVIRGICGVDISEEDTLNINPLMPDDTWEYFLLDNVYYKGKKLTVMYDKTGNKYARGKGLQVFVNDTPMKIYE